MNERRSSLEKILDDCKQRLDEDKKDLSYQALQTFLSEPFSHRSFCKALSAKVAQSRPAIIAEIKKKSPSQGLLCTRFDPVEIAKSYEKNGAACLSILCERNWFGGDLSHLKLVREKTCIPLMRKDFIFDSYQISQSRYFGADCILLILSMLDDSKAKELEQEALEIGLEVLIEVHNPTELARAIDMQSSLIGMNNRNLKDLRVDNQRALEIAQSVPSNKILIAESGLTTADDICSYLTAGVYCFLIGTAFMKEDTALNTPTNTYPGDRLGKLLKEIA